MRFPILRNTHLVGMSPIIILIIIIAYPILLTSINVYNPDETLVGQPVIQYLRLLPC